MLFDVLGTWGDLGLENYKQPTVKQASTVAAAAMAEWAQCAPQQQEVLQYLSNQTVSTHEPAVGPFTDNDANEVWAGRVLVNHDTLAQTDILKADPPNFQTVIKNPQL